ncbi:MAG: hypothetical protein ABI426_04790 [Flavobacterium sp.]
MYDMLGAYSYDQTDASNFELTFEIPDNCFYAVTPSTGAYSVAIKLNPGETVPSTTFMRCAEDLTISTKTVSTCFEQYLKTGTIIKKPKIDIQF